MSKPKVLVLLAMIAEQSGEKVSENRIDFVGSRLLELGTSEQVADALTKILESSRRFPTVAEVREAMGVAEANAKDVALMLADRVLAGVAKYGDLAPGNVKGAKAIEFALGPAAWSLVMKHGGWNYVVDRAAEGGIFKAQLRDSADSYLKCGVIKREELIRDALPSYHTALQSVEKLLLTEGSSNREIYLIEQQQ